MPPPARRPPFAGSSWSAACDLGSRGVQASAQQLARLPQSLTLNVSPRDFLTRRFRLSEQRTEACTAEPFSLTFETETTRHWCSYHSWSARSARHRLFSEACAAVAAPAIARHRSHLTI